MPALLTKSQLLSFAQCSRKMWLEMRRPDITPPTDAGGERRKREGIQVGEISRQSLGPDVIWPRAQGSKDLSATHAKALLTAQPGTPGVEIPVYFDDVYSRADALIPTEEGGYILRETKASTFPIKKTKDNAGDPGEPDPDLVIDAAIQTYVAREMGYDIPKVELSLINNRWKYPGKRDYSGLFRIMDVTDQVNSMVPDIPGMVSEARAVLEGSMPVKTTGGQCKKPHACPYLETCKAMDPPAEEHPIELLPDAAGKALARKLKNEKGYTSLLQPKGLDWGAPKALNLYLRMQEAHRTGLPILDPHSGAELVNLPYPRYFFDFEGIDLAVPEWEGVRPYEQIPYQWSCHIETAPGVFTHAEFLDLSGNDPSLPCIEHMLRSIDVNDGGPLYVYHATYEKGRLQELAQRHPQYEDELFGYINRLVDLLPIVKNNYYHPDMKGSFSIKKVLPTIAPDLDYGELEEVQDGVAAQIAYITAALEKTQTPVEKATTDLNSRIYCRQDTWAMVEVEYFLRHQPRPMRPEEL